LNESPDIIDADDDVIANLFRNISEEEMTVRGPTSALSSFLNERGIRTRMRTGYDMELVPNPDAEQAEQPADVV
jgi:hypothetical protein